MGTSLYQQYLATKGGGASMPTEEPTQGVGTPLYQQYLASKQAAPASAPVMPAGAGPQSGVAPRGALFSFLSALGQNGLWGVDDKLNAAVSSLVHDHDLSHYKFYLDLLQRQRAADASAHPVANATGALTGLVASPLNKLLPVGGNTLAGTIGKTALGGAIAGGVMGAGQAPSGQELQQGVLGAGLGGVSGGLLGGALGLGAELLPMRGAMNRLGAAVEGSGGPQAITQALAAREAIGKAGTATLADLSPRLRALADQVANSSEPAREAIEATAMSRQAGQSGRILQDLQSGIGADETPSIAARQAALEASREAWAGPAYDALRAANPAVDSPAFRDAMGKLIQQPKLRAVWNEAQQTGLVGPFPDEAAKAIQEFGPKLSDYQEKAAQLADLGLDPEKITGLIGPAPEAPGPSYQMLQNMKQSLDRAVGGAYRTGRTDLATRLSDARDVLQNFMVGNVPGYADVNAEYARRMGLERALAAGAKAFNTGDVGALQQQVGALSPAELEQFRYGLAAKQIEQLGKAQTNRDLGSQIVNSGPVSMAKLRTIFGDEPTMQRFMQQAQAEANDAKLRGTFGGSATARRFGGNLRSTLYGGLGAWALIHPHYLPYLLGVQLAKTGAANALERQGGEIAPMLMAQGPEAIRSALARIMALRTSLLPYAAQQGAQVAGGAAGSYLGSP